MTFFEIYALFLAPLLALVILGAFADWFGSWLERRHPGRFGCLWIEEDGL